LVSPLKLAFCCESTIEAGVNSVLQTLTQIFEKVLLETETQLLTILPCFSISDWPDSKARGVLLDISRTKVPTMDTQLTLIDQFSKLKYNQIQLYTEHTFAFSNQGWSKAKCQKEGATHVYIDFLAKIKQQVDKRHHKMMFWSDIVLKEPECLKNSLQI